MVTDDERALVWRAVHAQRAYFEREQRERDRAQAREEWFYASTTRDEAIERGTQCYLAAVRSVEAPPPEPLLDVHVDVLRAMVRSGELSAEQACLVAGFRSAGTELWTTEFSLLRFWLSALSDAAFEQRFEGGDVPQAFALERGLLPRSISDDAITDAILDACHPFNSDAAQRTVLERVSRARILAALQVRLDVNERGVGARGSNDWITARANDASVSELLFALIERDDRRVSDLSERLRERRATEADLWRWVRSDFDEREAICAQLCRFGHHSLALAYFEAIVRDPIALVSVFGARARGIAPVVAQTLRSHLAPQTLADCVERAVNVYSSRAATVREWLSISVLASTSEQRSTLAERARAAFEAEPCVVDGALIPRELRAAWAPLFEQQIHRWIDSFEARALLAYDSFEVPPADEVLRAILHGIDHTDPAMVRAVWGAIGRLRRAVDALPRSSEAQVVRSWTHGAALYGSAEAREHARVRMRRSRASSMNLIGSSLAEHSSPRAQARWIERIAREAPGASAVNEITRPTAEQQRTIDLARIEAGRESLWELVADRGVVSREARAMAFDRWYRAGCPVDSDRCYRDASLAELRARARSEGECERRTRWLFSRDELLAWIEALDVAQDRSWRAEPGLRWLIETLDGDDRGRAQLRRLLDERAGALRGFERWSTLSYASEREVELLLPFASEPQLLRVLDDEAVLTALLEFGATDVRRALGETALRLGLSAASSVARHPDLRDLAIDTPRGIAVFAEENASSAGEAVAMIETFAPDVRALSDDWRGEIERWLCIDAKAALRRYRECDEALRAKLRPFIEASGESARAILWAIEDDEHVLGDLSTFAPDARYDANEYLATVHRFGGTAAIDAIGDVLVQWIIDEERGRA